MQPRTPESGLSHEQEKLVGVNSNQLNRRRFLKATASAAAGGALAYSTPSVAFAQSNQALSPNSAFENMAFENYSVVLDSQRGFQHTATLNGEIRVSASGVPSGSIAVSFDDGSAAVIRLARSFDLSIETGGSTLDLLANDPDITVGTLGAGDLVQTVDLTSLADVYATDVNVDAVTPSLMSNASRAFLALAALANTQTWARNVQAAREREVAPASRAKKRTWCKYAVWAAVAAVAVTAWILCAVGCAAAGAVSLGGLLVPCALFCSGAVFLGATALVFAMLAVWKP